MSSWKDLIEEGRSHLNEGESEAPCQGCGSVFAVEDLNDHSHCSDCASVLCDAYAPTVESYEHTGFKDWEDFKRHKKGKKEYKLAKKVMKSDDFEKYNAQYDALKGAGDKKSVPDVDDLFAKYGLKGDGKGGYYNSQAYKPVEKWTSAGGVVMHGFSAFESKYVYVCKPSGNFNGGQWHFPKGRVDGNDTKEDTAIREVWEESGLKAKLLPNGYLGKYSGSMSETHFYMMVRTGGSPLKHGWESDEVRAVTLDEANELFKSSGNRRDVEVVAKAREFIQALQAKMQKK